MIEDWIDKVAAIAGSVRGAKTGMVRSYAVFKKAEIPEDLSEYPCAITFVDNLKASYSSGGVCIDLWSGTTEFHLFPDIAKGNMPECMRYFSKIRAAFAAAISLGGSVEHCVLRADLSLEFVAFTYGTGNPHHGIAAHWEVKENVTGKFTVGG